MHAPDLAGIVPYDQGRLILQFFEEPSLLFSDGCAAQIVSNLRTNGIFLYEPLFGWRCDTAHGQRCSVPTVAQNQTLIRVWNSIRAWAPGSNSFPQGKRKHHTYAQDQCGDDGVPAKRSTLFQLAANVSRCPKGYRLLIFDNGPEQGIGG